MIKKLDREDEKEMKKLDRGDDILHLIPADDTVPVQVVQVERPSEIFFF